MQTQLNLDAFQHLFRKKPMKNKCYNFYKIKIKRQGKYWRNEWYNKLIDFLKNKN